MLGISPDVCLLYLASVLQMLQTVSMGLRSGQLEGQTLVPNERASACLAMAWCVMLLKNIFLLGDIGVL